MLPSPTPRDAAPGPSALAFPPLLTSASQVPLRHSENSLVDAHWLGIAEAKPRKASMASRLFRSFEVDTESTVRSTQPG